MLESSVGCRFLSSPWAVAVPRLFLPGGRGCTALAPRTFGAHPPCCAGTLPRAQPQPKMMEISVSSPVLRSKQSQLFIGAASGQRRRRWLLIAGSSREARLDNSACTKGRVLQRLPQG